MGCFVLQKKKKKIANPDFYLERKKDGDVILKRSKGVDYEFFKVT